MTTSQVEALLSIALDMTSSLSLEDRSQRLVQAVLRVLPYREGCGDCPLVERCKELLL